MRSSPFRMVMPERASSDGQTRETSTRPEPTSAPQAISTVRIASVTSIVGGICWDESRISTSNNAK